jgi:hypothetical protein
MEVEEQKITEGWMDKPEGMLQMLWERGFMMKLNCSNMP